ncbi:Protein phosphatase 1 regulatory subunit 3C, partial [Clarias magur]
MSFRTLCVSASPISQDDLEPDPEPAQPPCLISERRPSESGHFGTFLAWSVKFHLHIIS